MNYISYKSTPIISLFIFLNFFGLSGQEKYTVYLSNDIDSIEVLKDVEVMVTTPSSDFQYVTDSLGRFSFELFESDSLISIHIQDLHHQRFYNEYYIDQLKELDTIQLHYTWRWTYTLTAVFFDGENCVFKGYGEENAIELIYYWVEVYGKRHIVNLKSVIFNMYAADKKIPKCFYREVKKIYDGVISDKDIPKDKLRLKVNKGAYTSTVANPDFKKGTIIDDKFINNQNTKNMREIANQYYYVLELVFEF